MVEGKAFMDTRVLLVDDEKDFVDVLAERLESRNFSVTCASNGDEAIATIKQSAFDVVILDVQMPGKGGLETLNGIKQLNPLLEVIMLTGHGTIQTAIEGMKLGAYDFLLKPTDMAELVGKILKARARKAEQEEKIRQAEIQHIVQTRGW
jgi:two-component system, OmpR family, response regulator CpxR